MSGDLGGFPVLQHRQNDTGAQNGSPVNLVLHTTETDSLVGDLQFPSNFQCGEGKIVQHIQLGRSGDAVFTYDRDCIGIEMVGRSQLGLWLPGLQTLGPTVALVAWLHSTGRIKTGLKRPPALANLPVVLDKLPAAVVTYYRRMAPTQDGVYGHVDLSGGNSHWDPGSFNYPVFFQRVQAQLGGGDDDVAFADFQEGWNANQDGQPMGANWPDDKKFGWKARNQAVNQPAPVPGPAGPKGDKGDKGDPGDAAQLAPGTTLKVQ